MRFLFIFLFPFYCFASSVIVSVAPHKFFVEKIAGKELEVILMIPAGASPHSYEPTPKEILKASKADMWFRIGEGFEKKAIQSIKAGNPGLTVVDLRKGLPLLIAPHHHDHASCCGEEGFDLHIWMSLRLAKTQATTIAEALKAKYPEKSELFDANLKKFLGELSALDDEISRLLLSDKGKTMMVSHPAFAYLGQDYGLKQLSIEFEGKDPTPQTMNNTLERARREKIKTIFLQPQYTRKGAELIAKLLHASLITLDPYSEDYLNNMWTMAQKIHEGL